MAKGGLVPKSLSAVSEAPASEGSSRAVLVGRFGYSDLKEAALPEEQPMGFVCYAEASALPVEGLGSLSRRSQACRWEIVAGCVVCGADLDSGVC
jgi:hypothetical protein